jgi:ParB family chromosome partitioning protein
MKQRTLRANEEKPELRIPFPQFSNQPRQPSLETADDSGIDAPTMTMPSALDSTRNMKIIGVHLIDPNPLAPREVYTPQMIQERAEDLRSQGQHDPIHVIANPEAPGRFIICDGWTRVQACREHKVLESLLAEVHDGLSLRDSAWFGYEQNEGRAQQCDLDRALFYDKLIAAGESSAEIARRAKVSKTMMTFYRAYARLPNDILDIARQYPQKFGATEAYQLSRLSGTCDLSKAVILASKYAAEGHTVRWLINQVESLISPAAHKARTAGKTVRYKNGVYKQRGDSFELTITVEAEYREVFAQGLEKLLDMVAVQSTEDTSSSGK